MTNQTELLKQALLTLKEMRWVFLDLNGYNDNLETDTLEQAQLVILDIEASLITSETKNHE